MKSILFCLIICLFATSCSASISTSSEQLAQITSMPENVIYFFPVDTVSEKQLIISGKAPPNVSVTIINITLAGTEIISGKTDNEGVFRFQVNLDLAGCRIGLVINDNITTNQYRSGENAMNIPQLGYFWDTLVIR